MPERDYAPPPDLTPVALMAWAVKQIETATCEGEIRAAMRVILAQEPYTPMRSFLPYVRQRLLEVGVTLRRSQ
jgi:hypothetical protein